MKTTNIVKGTFTGNDANGIMEWICPLTEKIMQCQGQFAFDEDGYWHDVYDDDDNYLYTVIS